MRTYVKCSIMAHHRQPARRRTTTIFLTNGPMKTIRRINMSLKNNLSTENSFSYNGFLCQVKNMSIVDVVTSSQKLLPNNFLSSCKQLRYLIIANSSCAVIPTGFTSDLGPGTSRHVNMSLRPENVAKGSIDSPILVSINETLKSDQNTKLTNASVTDA